MPLNPPRCHCHGESHVALMMRGEEGIAGLPPALKSCLFIFFPPPDSRTRHNCYLKMDGWLLSWLSRHSVVGFYF